MMRRILGLSVPIACSIVPWPAVSSENIPFFKPVGPTRVLTVNLNQDVDRDTLVELRKATSAELKKAQTPARREEIDAILGLVAYREGKYAEAAAKLAPLAAHPDLGERASYYWAFAGIKQAQALKGEDPARSLSLCDESRKTLAGLMGLTSSAAPFYRKGYYESSYCVAQALLAAKKPEARDFVEKLLEGWIEIKPAQAQFLYTNLLDLYLAEGKADLARTALRNAKKSLADPSWTTLYEFDHPELKDKGDAPIAAPSPAPVVDRKLEAIETEFAAEMNRLYAEKKHAAAIEWGAALLRPGSGMEKSAKALPPLLRATRQSLKDDADHEPLFIALGKLPSYHQYKIARDVWEDGNDREANRVFEQIVATHPTADETPYALFFMGRIAEDAQNWPQAAVWFEKLVTNFPDSVFFKRAVFKLGWLSYLIQRDKEAIRWLTHAHTLADHPNQKAEAYYWLHKTYLRLDSPAEAQKYLDLIGTESPLSFYSFVIGRLPPVQKRAANYRYALSPEDGARLRKIRALFAVGLTDDAVDVLDEFNSQQNFDLTVEAISMLEAARRYLPAIILAYNAIHESANPSLTEELVRAIFPLEFRGAIAAAAKAQRLDAELLFALIKQESAYDERAVSKAGALGLMQLMLPTAQLLAKAAKQSPVTRADLLRGERNVFLGARYLRELVDRFDGNFVYAVAAYNAGPGKVEAWRKNWGTLPPEVFVELIPFDETRNYVKLVLRNYAFYARMNRKAVSPGKVFAATRG